MGRVPGKGGLSDVGTGNTRDEPRPVPPTEQRQGPGGGVSLPILFALAHRIKFDEAESLRLW